MVHVPQIEKINNFSKIGSKISFVFMIAFFVMYACTTLIAQVVITSKEVVPAWQQKIALYNLETRALFIKRAQAILAYQYAYGKNFPRNLQKSVEYSTQAAKDGDAFGALFLGVAYEKGLAGLPKDPEKIIFWLEKAASDADEGPFAQTELGIFYANGKIIPANHKLAVKWLTLAANKGIADAQNNLGIQYLRGDGVDRDIKQARFWFEKAAAQKSEEAISNLKLLDKIESY